MVKCGEIFVLLDVKDIVVKYNLDVKGIELDYTVKCVVELLERSELNFAPVIVHKGKIIITELWND